MGSWRPALIGVVALAVVALAAAAASGGTPTASVTPGDTPTASVTPGDTPTASVTPDDTPTGPGASIWRPTPFATGQEDPYLEARREMVRRHIAAVPLGARRITEPAVLEAMLAVPRHEFVRPRLRGAAYRNRPLPIGHGQTISQPYIVALMTELLEPEPGDRVLEIGTGSGYQAAVLAEIVDSVFTIEIIEPLATSARERLRRLGYDRVLVRHGDGYFGWPERAPFDGIVVTAAATHIPPPLTEQLARGGRMVIPVGPPFRVQQLVLVEKRADGSVRQRTIAPVQFVPFTRAEP